MASVQFWLGPTGTGKSQRIVEQLKMRSAREPIGAPLLWVVPDDVAFVAEQMLMERIPSVLRAEVITTTRLAERIRSFALGQVTNQTITRTGKQILFASAYQARQHELGPLKRTVMDSQFYQMVLDVFDEFSAYDVDLSSLQGALESAAASLTAHEIADKRTSGLSLLGKLRDLCLLYVEYRHLLDERQLADPSLLLSDAAQVVPLVSWISSTRFYVDGFSDMTPQEIRFFSTLAEHGQSCVFTATLDSAHMRSLDESFGLLDPLGTVTPRLSTFLRQHSALAGESYATTAYTMYLLRRRLNELGVPFEDEVFGQLLRFQSQGLSVAEHLFRNVYQATSAHGSECSDMTFHAAPDEQAEVVHLARDITQLVEQGNVSYRDIAVIVPTLQDVQSHLQARFSASEIPFSLNEFPPLSTHPLGRFILAAIRLLREQVSLESMGYFLRTDYLGMSMSDVDAFDFYIRTHHISSISLWQANEPWTFAVDASSKAQDLQALYADERADRIRRRLYDKFAPFLVSLSSYETTPEQVARALWALLVAFQVKEQVAQAVVQQDERVNPLAASQEEQAWSLLVALLNDLAGVHADRHFPLDGVLDLVEDALAQMHLSTIPGGVDEVFVTDFQHAKSWSRPYVFVLGLDEHHLPVVPAVRGLLQDDERETFTTLFGVPLGWTMSEQAVRNRQIPYDIFTRASAKLSLSYALLRGNAPCQPALHYERVRQVIGAPVMHINDLFETGIVHGNSATLPVVRPQIALEMTVDWLSTAKAKGMTSSASFPTFVLDTAAFFAKNEDSWRVFTRALRGLQHSIARQPLSKSLVERLYGLPLRTSVNRLEAYAACAYAYFLRYGLRIEPTTFDTIEATDIGNLLHDTLFSLMDAVRRGDIDFSSISKEEAFEHARVAFTSQLERAMYGRFQSKEARKVHVADIAVALQTVTELLWHQMVDGAYRPHALEWSFGLDSDVPPFYLTLENGEVVELRGRVDRLDVYQDEHGKWLRIFDYKTKSYHRLDATKVSSGLQLQLLTYAAVVNGYFGADEPVRLGGVFYQPLVAQPGIVNEPSQESDARRARLKAIQAEGFMNSDAANVQAMDAQLNRGESLLFPKVYKQDGAFLKNAKVWSDSDWSQLMDFALDTAKHICEEMLSGDISVRPYLAKHQDRACTNCAFQAVCHFEPMDHFHHYRLLKGRRFSDMVAGATSTMSTGDDGE